MLALYLSFYHVLLAKFTQELRNTLMPWVYLTLASREARGRILYHWSKPELTAQTADVHLEHTLRGLT
jgi:hypothetical protein